MQVRVKCVQVFSNGSSALSFVSLKSLKQFKFFDKDHINVKKKSTYDTKFINLSDYKSKYF
jgi:hypothetical protein